jgi:predicted metal-dependent hydrolase
MDPTRPFEARPFDDHDVRPRRTWFTFPASIPPLWLGGSPIRTHFFDAINMFVPAFEEFGVRVMKQQLRSVGAAALREQLRGFMGQEATHSKVHDQYNHNLRAHGYRFATYMKVADFVFEEVLERRAGLRLCLSVMASFEHLTAVLSEVSLESRMFDGATPEMQALYEWHAAEELEHKTLVFDCLRAIGGRYPLRAAGGVLGAAIGFGFLLSGMFLLAAQDPGFVAPKTARDLRALFFGKDRFLPRLLAGYARYFAPHFHPSQHDTRQHAEAVLGRAPRGSGV